jgi:hypothetical protein
VAAEFGNIAAEDWYRGMALLYSLAGCERAGIVAESGGEVFVFTQEERWALSNTLEGEALAAHYLASGLSDHATQRTMITAAQQTEYAQFSRTYCGALREYALERVKKQCVVECCPTSNLVLGGIGYYEEHPVWEFARTGLTVTVSSDDPVIFGSSVLEEFLRLSSFDDEAVLPVIAAAGVGLCAGGTRKSLAHYERALLTASAV